MGFSVDNTRVARKAHDCDSCDVKIQPGVEYLDSTIMSDDDDVRFMTVKSCAACLVKSESELQELAESDEDPNEWYWSYGNE